MHSTVTRLLKVTDEEQKVILRAFVKMPLESRIKVLDNNRNIFYPLKEQNKDVPIPILAYASLVLAINQYLKTTDNVDKNVLKIRTKSFRKQPKRDKLLGKWALIKSLKNDNNLSFRQISNYLKMYHRLSVVHSTIFDMWTELEVTKKQGEK